MLAAVPTALDSKADSVMGVQMRRFEPRFMWKFLKPTKMKPDIQRVSSPFPVRFHMFYCCSQFDRSQFHMNMGMAEPGTRSQLSNWFSTLLRTLCAHLIC